MARTAGYDGDMCADGPRGDSTRCLCVVAAFFAQTALEPRGFLRGGKCFLTASQILPATTEAWLNLLLACGGQLVSFIPQMGEI